MRYATFLRELETHYDGLRAAAVTAGPDAPVPTCPRWTVRRLVGHLGRVHSWVASAIADPSGNNLRRADPPEEWDALLSWADEHHDALIEAFGTDPASAAWVPFARYEPIVASWARRQAHEAAIHRLDAEHAAEVDTVTFDPEFAADGIDELLHMLLTTKPGWDGVTVSGSVLVHAADAGRVWVTYLQAGRPPHIEPVTAIPAGVDADVTVAGTADSVYRAMWRRPSTAGITGDSTLLEPLASP